jgi:peptidoglycan/LPS O-acetylase OafA/YrhL
LILDAPATANSQRSRRIPALDFTKGALVLIMVLYHWINYFIGPQWGYYPYLRFLTPSFIFITGFMVSHVYLAKYSPADSRLWKRLFTRGVKLMTIFLGLNLARNVVVPLLGTGVAMQNLPSLGSLFTVFVSGNLPVVETKIVSFSILVPISYLLMFSGILMVPFRRYRYTFHVTFLFLMLSIGMLKLVDARSFNLEFVAIGMMGVLSGFTPVEKINEFIRHRYVIAFAYLCYTVAVMLWNVPFPLLLVGVLLSLTVLYAVGTQGNESGALQNMVILLGKYSLLGYISQVAILQILRAGFQRLNLGLAALPVSFLAAFALTIASVELINRARARSTSVDRLYKAVFA